MLLLLVVLRLHLGLLKQNLLALDVGDLRRVLAGVLDPETSERVNGRAAMLGMAALVALGVVF